MKIKAVIALGATFIGIPASAHWQYTEWGMTPAQVIAASDGKLSAVIGEAGHRTDGSVEKVSGTYETGGRAFETRLFFKENGLHRVELTFHEGDMGTCLGLRPDLIGVYGEPAQRDPSSIGETIIWSDKTGGNRVMYSYITVLEKCDLIYTPIASGRGGL